LQINKYKSKHDCLIYQQTYKNFLPIYKKHPHIKTAFQNRNQSFQKVNSIFIHTKPSYLFSLQTRHLSKYILLFISQNYQAGSQLGAELIFVDWEEKISV